ncbi:MAG: biopolymer transporter ExbD [Opitutales bacterium]|nr:biopolymer transporter ExbD [Opitutales bacterium]NRA26204.1 biopolymer transporter ExbD [Opitutales bacterium]
MVDVLMVLLFFFLLSMQFGDLRALNISLPNIETAGENTVTDTMIIQMDLEEQIYLNNEPVTEEFLIAAVTAQAGINSETPVLLAMDEEISIKDLTRIIDICRANGLQRVRLQSE